MPKVFVMQFRVGALLLLSICVCSANDPLVDEAVLLIHAGKLEEGSSLLNAAIKANPERAGNRNSIDGSISISEKALAHGREQFQRLAQDRPEILHEGTHFEPLHKWAINEFAGASLGFLVDWDKSEPTLQVIGASAECVQPFRGQNAKIRIAATKTDALGQNRSLEFEELWFCLAFELCNLRGTPSLRRLDTSAWRGELSRVAYVKKMFRLEHQALQVTHSFYATRFLPCASAAKIQSRPDLWYVTQAAWWQRSDDLINVFPFDAYPWKFYGDRYDKLVRMAREGKVEGE